LLPRADVAELVDALDLGSSGQPCRFDSCHPYHFSKDMSMDIEELLAKFLKAEFRLSLYVELLKMGLESEDTTLLESIASAIVKEEEHEEG
jgi:hypothetical protein